MKIFCITFLAFLAGVHSAQALSCNKCPDDSPFNDCVKNLETVTCSVGWNQCFNLKYFLKKSSGEQILYMNKQCGLDFICNQPDPKYVCNTRNTTFTSQGHELINCTSRCCPKDMCNNDDLPSPPTAPSATVAPNNQTGNTSTTATPAGCGTDAIKMPRRMTIVLAAMLQMALKLI